jgi:ABC-type anion transport system duplicated permease subunit
MGRTCSCRILSSHKRKPYISNSRRIDEASNVANGHSVIAARASSLLFAIAATIFGIILTKDLMDLASKRYVVEE